MPLLAVLMAASFLQNPAQAAPDSAAARAFESYEAIRIALSADRLDEAAIAQARAFVPLAEQLAGAEARAAAEKLAAATDVKAARAAFGPLSKLVVPKFLEAKLDGVHGFDCSMVKQPWAQRGNKVENPYMGKKMLTCGVPIKK